MKFCLGLGLLRFTVEVSLIDVVREIVESASGTAFTWGDSTGVEWSRAA